MSHPGAQGPRAKDAICQRCSKMICCDENKCCTKKHRIMQFLQQSYEDFIKIIKN